MKLKLTRKPNNNKRLTHVQLKQIKTQSKNLLITTKTNKNDPHTSNRWKPEEKNRFSSKRTSRRWSRTRETSFRSWNGSVRPVTIGVLDCSLDNDTTTGRDLAANRWQACKWCRSKNGELARRLNLRQVRYSSCTLTFVVSYNQIIHVIRASYLCCFFHDQWLVVSNLRPNISHRHPCNTLCTKINSSNKFPNFRSYKFALN